MKTNTWDAAEFRAALARAGLGADALVKRLYEKGCDVGVHRVYRWRKDGDDGPDGETGRAICAVLGVKSSELWR